MAKIAKITPMRKFLRLQHANDNNHIKFNFITPANLGSVQVMGRDSELVTCAHLSCSGDPCLTGSFGIPNPTGSSTALNPTVVHDWLNLTEVHDSLDQTVVHDLSAEGYDSGWENWTEFLEYWVWGWVNLGEGTPWVSVNGVAVTGTRFVVCSPSGPAPVGSSC